jgi:hypothetical protein
MRISTQSAEILARYPSIVFTDQALQLPRGHHSAPPQPHAHMPEDDFVNLILEHRSLRYLSMYEWGFQSISESNLQRLRLGNAFEMLRCWEIGWNAALNASTLFALLSMMPVLETLLLGCIHDDVTVNSPVVRPACGLKTLRVVDDWGIDFIHYPLLLSNSRTSLKRAYVAWVFVDRSGAQFANGLEQCTNLRSLTLAGNHFSLDTSSRIMRACSRIRHLSMISISDGISNAPPDVRNAVFIAAWA